MKKFLFLLIAVLAISFATKAQVTVTIDNIETVTKGKQKGDLITYTISSQNVTDIWGVTFNVTFENGKSDHAGVWNPHVFTNQTITTTAFIGLDANALKLDRTYTITVLYDGYNDPNNPDYMVVSAPYTVTAN